MPLETPLFGRFIGENRRLIFAPAPEYLALVGCCVFGGGVAALIFFLSENRFCGLVSSAVALAGVWGALSLQWISFEIRAQARPSSEVSAGDGTPSIGSYIRREGPGMFPQTTRGNLEELEAIFLLAEERVLFGRQVTYRLVLQWKNLTQISMVLQQDYRTLSPGIPLGAGGGRLGQIGQRAAKMLGIHFVDHSHVSTPNPIPVR